MLYPIIGNASFHQESEKANGHGLGTTGSYWLKSTDQINESSAQVTLPSMKEGAKEYTKDNMDSPTGTPKITTKLRCVVHWIHTYIYMYIILTTT